MKKSKYCDTLWLMGNMLWYLKTHVLRSQVAYCKNYNCQQLYSFQHLGWLPAFMTNPVFLQHFKQIDQKSNPSLPKEHFENIKWTVVLYISWLCFTGKVSVRSDSAPCSSLCFMEKPCAPAWHTQVMEVSVPRAFSGLLHAYKFPFNITIIVITPFTYLDEITLMYLIPSNFHNFKESEQVFFFFIPSPHN